MQLALRAEPRVGELVGGDARLVVAERGEAERVGEPARRVDGAHERAAARARALERDRRGGGGLAHAAGADADDDPPARRGPRTAVMDLQWRRGGDRVGHPLDRVAPHSAMGSSGSTVVGRSSAARRGEVALRLLGAALPRARAALDLPPPAPPAAAVADWGAGRDRSRSPTQSPPRRRWRCRDRRARDRGEPADGDLRRLGRRRKTTVAAAIALDRALAGGRALVCTIDPARRLANALGLSSLGNVESRVPDHKSRTRGSTRRASSTR